MMAIYRSVQGRQFFPTFRPVIWKVAVVFLSQTVTERFIVGRLHHYSFQLIGVLWSMSRRSAGSKMPIGFGSPSMPAATNRFFIRNLTCKRYENQQSVR